MRTIAVTIALGLAACASGPIQLPPSVKTSGQYIDRIEARYAGSATTADAQKCAALELTNPDVLITGTAGGALRSGPPTAQVMQGGGVVQQVGDDFVIVRGAAEYSVLGGVTSRAVRFTVVIDLKPDQIKMTAGDISQVQLQAGIAAPTGFQRVGTWTGSGSTDAVSAIQAELDQLAICLRN